jgi:hypothetical protein
VLEGGAVAVERPQHVQGRGHIPRVGAHLGGDLIDLKMLTADLLADPVQLLDLVVQGGRPGGRFAEGPQGELGHGRAHPELSGQLSGDQPPAPGCFALEVGLADAGHRRRPGLLRLEGNGGRVSVHGRHPLTPRPQRRGAGAGLLLPACPAGGTVPGHELLAAGALAGGVGALVSLLAAALLAGVEVRAEGDLGGAQVAV